MSPWRQLWPSIFEMEAIEFLVHRDSQKSQRTQSLSSPIFPAPNAAAGDARARTRIPMIKARLGHPNRLSKAILKSLSALKDGLGVHGCRT